MPTLSERIAWELDALKAEKDRLKVQFDANLADVDAKLAVLREAKRVVTKDVEAAYDALCRAKLIRGVD